MEKIDVALGQDSYTIEIARGLWKDVGTKIRSLSKAEKVAVITDDTVDALYGKALEEKLSKEGFMVRRFIFPHGEHHKTLAVFETMVRACAQFGMTRSDLVVALGGGVVGDLAGFVAASFLRGIDFIQIPTTLLSQIDSSVGGKVAVDLPEGKNLVGAFYQPRGVFIDPDLLDTLPVRYLHDGFAEVIKCGAFGSADFFAALESLPDDRAILAAAESIIHRCILIKVAVVEKDERDTGARMVLNFGHTIGHAVEKLSDFGLSHGVCVGLGMVAASYISCQQGNLTKEQLSFIEETLKHFGLLIRVSGQNPDDVLRTTKLDKKMVGNQIKFILLKTPGDAYIEKNLTDEQILEGIFYIYGKEN